MTSELPAPHELVTRVLAVDGVTDIYAPAPTAARLPELIAAATGISPDGPASEIVVTSTGGDTTVAARIATSSQDNTVETARRVADTILARTPLDAHVTVQVARIH
ncbi:hypothetical protein MUN76_10075 [Leucobacter rhizosphaerae]|uniref:Asp23/Gls24 family envelope stress response protein n=1 Tax=Leucobacter rhizosphaerae TaxID=2932245 RepID=A0ABY4FT15_9MICO|nr:hypothetical protein [Leucobacter rhizosphaerae]UOQ59400.1 hypothetical protein MUN76_10075 [Leucobacter rhizosphaerae]